MCVLSGFWPRMILRPMAMRLKMMPTHRSILSLFSSLATCERFWISHWHHQWRGTHPLKESYKLDPSAWIVFHSFFFFLPPLALMQATMLFAELNYTLATEEAERIGVDHVARMTATGTGENSTGKSWSEPIETYVKSTSEIRFRYLPPQWPSISPPSTVPSRCCTVASRSSWSMSKQWKRVRSPY